MDKLLLLARERAKLIDSILSEIAQDLKIDCGRGCTYCCYGVPLWVKTIEAIHLLEALNGLPLKDRKIAASRLRDYEKEYTRIAQMQGYTPRSPIQEEALDVEKLGLVCGLGMNETPCPFLWEDGSCRVYEARPSMCRLTLFHDREVCRRDWENPLAFVWKNEIAPFTEGIKRKFYRRWNSALRELQAKYPDLDLVRLESEILFLPRHLKFDPVKKVFRLRASYSP